MAVGGGKSATLPLEFKGLLLLVVLEVMELPVPLDSKGLLLPLLVGDSHWYEASGWGS